MGKMTLTENKLDRLKQLLDEIEDKEDIYKEIQEKELIHKRLIVEQLSRVSKLYGKEYSIELKMPISFREQCSNRISITLSGSIGFNGEIYLNISEEFINLLNQIPLCELTDNIDQCLDYCKEISDKLDERFKGLVE
jgi:hypothetical protein